MECLVVNYSVPAQAETKAFVNGEEVGDEGEGVEGVEMNIDW